MKVRKILYIMLCMALFILCVACQKEVETSEGKIQIYFFDSSKNELVAEALPEEFFTLTNEQDQVEYIISKLKDNKSILLSPMQMGPAMPIESDTTSINTKDHVVKVNFTEAYNNLTPQEKIGMRSSIVYSLTQLDFINGVDFYVGQVPLTTATGKPVGVITTDKINRSAFNPSPPTKAFVLNVYFANKEGKLVKEEHRITASNSSKEDKLVVEELIQGPWSNQLLATVPSDMKVNTVDTLNGVCQVELSFDPKSKFFENDETKTLMIYSIVNSLTELPQVKKVIISIAGQEEFHFTEEIELPKTFERSDIYIDQEERIT